MSKDVLEVADSKSFIVETDSGIGIQSKQNDMAETLWVETSMGYEIIEEREIEVEVKLESEESLGQVRETNSLVLNEKEKEKQDEPNADEELPKFGKENKKQNVRNQYKHEKEGQNSGFEDPENTILRWAKEEKQLLALKENLTSNVVDFGDYSILMYETQDAFNHCRNLRLKLQISEEQLRLKTNQCNMLMEQRKNLKKEVQRQHYESDGKVEALQHRLEDSEKRLLNVYGENEWLQGKYEEVKTLCVKYRERYFSSVSLFKKTKSQQLDMKVANINEDLNDENQAEHQLNSNLLDKTILQEESNIEEEIDEMVKQNIGNYEEKPRRDKFTDSQQSLDEEDVKKTIHDIKTIATRNDALLFNLTDECQKGFQENSKRVKQIFTENQETADKLERWIDNYMILKRKLEDGTEIYQRELKKSWNAEREYSEQIKCLCDTLNTMACELADGKCKLQTYAEHFEKIRNPLAQMQQQIEFLQQQCENKLDENDDRLASLTIKCEKLSGNKQKDSPSSSGGRRRSSSSRRLSKTLFNMKRRISETNEST